MRFYLVGFMGAGKTTYGRKLAQKLEYKFIDLDKFIEDKYRFTITSIFNFFGEEVFRQIEKQALLEVSEEDNVVIATGGGTPCFEDNMNLMNEFGISIYLYLNENQLFSRLINAKKKRPLIKDKNSEELIKFITNKLQEREVFYKKSKIIVDAFDIKFLDVYFRIKELL